MSALGPMERADGERVVVTEARAKAILKRLDRALWEEERLGTDLAGVNWQAVVGLMRGHVIEGRRLLAKALEDER